jgi:hypothetical protein
VPDTTATTAATTAAIARVTGMRLSESPVRYNELLLLFIIG